MKEIVLFMSTRKNKELRPYQPQNANAGVIITVIPKVQKESLQAQTGFFAVLFL